MLSNENKKIKYLINESINRLSLMIFSNALFDFPLLVFIRIAVLQKVFNTGNNCYFGNNIKFYRSHQSSSGKLSIGNNVHISDGVRIDFSGDVVIGDNVTISYESCIHSHVHRRTKTGINSDIVYTNLVIDNNAWIGSRSIILPQVNSIGKNATVGAGAVVSKSVNANITVVGNPAKEIRKKI